MDIELIVHKLLPAQAILVEGKEWSDLYRYFSNYPHGIYFYTFGDSKIPCYIGKCTASSYNILGRVWDELDDYRNGKYWVPRDVNKLKNLECFIDPINRSQFFQPDDEAKIATPEWKSAIKQFIRDMRISFSYLIAPAPYSPSEMIALTHDIEALLQLQLVRRFNLSPGWIGDGGINVTGANPDNQYKYNIKFLTDPIIDTSIFET